MDEYRFDTITESQAIFTAGTICPMYSVLPISGRNEGGGGGGGG